jgi:hypothetical protein
MTNSQYIAALKQERDLAIQYRADKIAELEKAIANVTANSKEVLTNSKNTIAVRKGFEMSGSVKHYIVSRADFNSLKERVK